MDVADRGLAIAVATMDRFYGGRWGEISGKDRRYLAALAHLGGSDTFTPSRYPITVLGGEAKSWSQTRARLYERGAVTLGHRSARIALPGFDRWITAQSGVLSEVEIARARETLNEGRSLGEPWARGPAIDPGIQLAGGDPVRAIRDSEPGLGR